MSGTNSVGRPSSYSDLMLAKARAFYLKYAEAEPFNVISKMEDNGETVETVINQVLNPYYTNPPYIEQLALDLDIDDETVTEWAKSHKEFSATIKRIKTLQKIRLYNNSMQRSSATGAIFLLKANHGLVETEKRILANDIDHPLINLGIGMSNAQRSLPAKKEIESDEDDSE